MDTLRDKTGRFITGKRRKQCETFKENFKKKFKSEDEKETYKSKFKCKNTEFDLLAEFLWCELCNCCLSLRDCEKETRKGLASLLYVRCPKCLDLKKIPTSKKLESKDAYCLYAVNCKAATGKQIK